MKGRVAAGYVALLAACFVCSFAGWTTLGVQFDNDVYDFLFRLYSPQDVSTTSVILGVDEESYSKLGGVRGIRRILCRGLQRMADAHPRAVVIDVILADAGDEQEDACLEAAFARTPNLVLGTDMAKSGWEDPIPRFAKSAVAVGHVHADPDEFDSIVRRIPLEKISNHRRFWALSLEAFRLDRGTKITEAPGGIFVGGMWIPAPRREARPLRVRYLRPPEATVFSIPQVTFAELETDPKAIERLRDKVVFIGITADSGAQDRHMTPYSFGRMIPGVEIHANAYETMARGLFLRDASNAIVVVICLGLCALIGIIFWRFSGWPAYALSAGLFLVASLGPYLAFRSGVVFPYMPPALAIGLSASAAASYQYFFVRRTLAKTEAERERYQRAIHWAVHEMRTPLTAIQGSSELMGRYKLPEEKRSEMARMINSESKRLAKMIQSFLDVERLNAGQMEMKHELFGMRDVVDVCVDRVKSLAERKKIRVRCGDLLDAIVTGDRELMEYAVYNLLTNAIKYSPAETEVNVFNGLEGGRLRLSVQDQGIGMDEKELKNIGKKFYRTKKAEASGEMGTGIGLSIVEQIVAHHGGKIEVSSSPGVGSCFTIVVPASVPAGE